MDAGFWSGLFSAVSKVATTKIPMIGGGSGQMNGTTEAVFDNSGWNVNFGSGALTSAAEKTIDQGATSAPDTPSVGMPYYGMAPAMQDNTLLYGAALVLIVVMLRKKKG